MDEWTGLTHWEGKTRIEATIHVRNDGIARKEIKTSANATDLRFAVRFASLDSFPPQSQRVFGKNKFKAGSPPSLPPYQDAHVYGSPADLAELYKPRNGWRSKVCIWGEFEYRDFTGDRGTKPFCRCASTQSIFDTQAGKAGGYGGPYEDCTEK